MIFAQHNNLSQKSTHLPIIDALRNTRMSPKCKTLPVKQIRFKILYFFRIFAARLMTIPSNIFNHR